MRCGWRTGGCGRCGAWPWRPSCSRCCCRAGVEESGMLRLIGPPAFTGQYRLPEPGITWNWRFDTPLRCIVFQVPFSVATGKVLEPGAYPPDPGCADEWM